MSFNDRYNIIKSTSSQDRSLLKNIKNLPTPIECLKLHACHPCEG